MKSWKNAFFCRVTASNILYTATQGLWKVCVSERCLSYSCSSVNLSCGQIMAARAFITLNCIILPIAGAILILTQLMGQYNNAGSMNAAKILSILGVVFGAISLGVGLNALNQGAGSIGPGAGVGIAAIIINLVGSIVSFLIRS